MNQIHFVAFLKTTLRGVSNCRFNPLSLAATSDVKIGINCSQKKMSNSRYRGSRGLPLETSASLKLGCGSSCSQLFGLLESDAKLPNGPFFCVFPTSAARESEGNGASATAKLDRLCCVFNSGYKCKERKNKRIRSLGAN